MKQIFKRIYLCIVLISFLLSGCSNQIKHVYGDNYAHTKKYMTQFIEDEMGELNITGVSVALLDMDKKDNPIVWAKGFGYADKEKKIPASPNTVYRAGSVAKLFTATAIMQLVEQGKIDLDQPIQTYLPELRIRSRFKNTDPVTIRNMLTHHSGLPGDKSNGFCGTNEKASTLINDVIDLASRPNTQYAYSNLAMSLLGLVIERVSGLSYEQYMQQNVLNPIGMKNSHFHHTLVPHKNHSKGYTNNKSKDILTLRDVSAGGLNSTVLDLAKFAQMNMSSCKDQTCLLPKKTLKNMQEKHFTSNSLFANNNVGFAWYPEDIFYIANPSAGIIKAHGGDIMLFHTSFKTLPKHKLAAIVMTNSASTEGSNEKIAFKMLQLALASKANIQFPTERQKLPNIQPSTTEDIKNLTGRWLFGETEIKITSKKNKMKANINGTSMNLVHRGNHKYYLDYRILGIPVNLQELGRIGIKYYNIGGQEVLQISTPDSSNKKYAEKITPQPLSKIWQKRLGTYTSPTKQSCNINKMTLEYKDDLLQLSAQGFMFEDEDPEHMTIHIKPINDYQAITYGVGRDTGYVINFETGDNGKLHLTYSGFKLVKN